MSDYGWQKFAEHCIHDDEVTKELESFWELVDEIFSIPSTVDRKMIHIGSKETVSALQRLVEGPVHDEAFLAELNAALGPTIQYRKRTWYERFQKWLSRKMT